MCVSVCVCVYVCVCVCVSVHVRSNPTFIVVMVVLVIVDVGRFRVSVFLKTLVCRFRHAAVFRDVTQANSLRKRACLNKTVWANQPHGSVFVWGEY